MVPVTIEFPSFTVHLSIMTTEPPSVHAYFDNLPDDRQLPMARLRQLVRHHWPKAKEDLAYGMPTYHLSGQPVFAIASQKNHITFYVMPYDLLSAFKHDLRTRNCGKSCIRFKRLEEEDMDLLERIVKYVGTTFIGSSSKLKIFSKA